MSVRILGIVPFAPAACDLMLIEWTDKDPETGAKRSVRAEKFARKWTFQVRYRRYATWEAPGQVTRDMWETLLDALERRLPRREGVADEDVKRVRAVLSAWKPPPEVEDSGTSPQRHEDHTKGTKKTAERTENSSEDSEHEGDKEAEPTKPV